jgi:hypothetical protein
MTDAQPGMSAAPLHHWAADEEETMTTNRRPLTAMLGAALLGGLAYAGVAIADDYDQPTRNEPQPRPTQPNAEERTQEPPIEHATPMPQSDQQQPYRPARPSEPLKNTVDKPLVDTYLRTWGKASTTAARATIASYGLPNEATPSMLIWYANGPWTKTVVFKDEVSHDFPRPHADVIEQVVEMRVPVGKIDDIAAFDGSVIVKRTEGLVAARSESEAMNFLAINLAYDIARSKKTTAQARGQLARGAVAIARGDAPEYTQSLQFEKPEESAADPDRTVIRQTYDEPAEKSNDQPQQQLPRQHIRETPEPDQGMRPQGQPQQNSNDIYAPMPSPSPYPSQPNDNQRPYPGPNDPQPAPAPGPGDPR